MLFFWQNMKDMMVQQVYHDGTVTVPSWKLMCGQGAGLIRIFRILELVEYWD